MREPGVCARWAAFSIFGSTQYHQFVDRRAAFHGLRLCQINTQLDFGVEAEVIGIDKPARQPSFPARKVIQQAEGIDQVRLAQSDVHRSRICLPVKI